MDWKDMGWCAFLYIVGYMAHDGALKLSFTFRAPSALAFLRGRPLKDNKLQFSPMTIQLVGLTCAVLVLLNQFDFLDELTAIWIEFVLLCTLVSAVLIPAFVEPLIRRKNKKSQGPNDEGSASS